MSPLDGVQLGLVGVVVIFLLNVLFESNVRTFIETHGWDTVLTRAISKMRERRSFWFAFGVVVGAAAMSWAFPWINPSPSETDVGYVKTELRLQFFGDARMPVAIGESANIYRWYTQFSPSIEVHLKDKDGNEIIPPGGSPKAESTWNLFVVFNRPAVFKQLIWTFSDPTVRAEIVDETARSFIFHTMTALPAGELIITGQK